MREAHAAIFCAISMSTGVAIFPETPIAGGGGFNAAAMLDFFCSGSAGLYIFLIKFATAIALFPWSTVFAAVS